MHKLDILCNTKESTVEDGKVVVLKPSVRITTRKEIVLERFTALRNICNIFVINGRRIIWKGIKAHGWRWESSAFM